MASLTPSRRLLSVDHSLKSRWLHHTSLSHALEMINTDLAATGLHAPSCSVLGRSCISMHKLYVATEHRIWALKLLAKNRALCARLHGSFTLACRYLSAG